MFDGNMVGHWRIFIHLKGVRGLGSKKSNVDESMEAGLFP
jgi:hypothetical protein